MPITHTGSKEFFEVFNYLRNLFRERGGESDDDSGSEEITSQNNATRLFSEYKQKEVKTIYKELKNQTNQNPTRKDIQKVIEKQNLRGKHLQKHLHQQIGKQGMMMTIKHHQNQF